MKRLIELGQMLFRGTKNLRAMARLIAHLVWSRMLFDRAFVTLLCCFVGASRRLESPEPPRHCYVHEVMNAVYRMLALSDPAAFVEGLGRVIDYLYQRGLLVFVGLGWHWEGASTGRCPSYLSRLLEQGYLRFDPERGAFRHERAYMRYTLEL